MDMFFWDTYRENEINEKIKYWVDLWEDLISNFNKNQYGLTFINPHLILRDIIDEIEDNKLKNKENKNYYNEQLDHIIKSDLVIKNTFLTDFSLIKRELNSHRIFYLLQLCKSVKKIFEQGNYFKESLATLKNILFDPSFKQEDKDAIKLICQNLILEFVLKSYSLKTIEKFPRNLFDKYHFQDKTLITNFPHKVSGKEYRKGELFDEDAFNRDVKLEIDSLSILQRIERLEDYYNAQSEVRYFIFQVEGIKGDVDIQIGDVNFYSPDIKRYIKKNLSSKFDLELFRSDSEHHFINAAVKMHVIDQEAAKLTAIEMIQKSLDLLRCFFVPKTTFDILQEEYLIVDENGREVGFSYSLSHRVLWYKWHDSLNLKEHNNDLTEVIGSDLLEKTKDFLFKPIDKQSNIEQKITRSLHWYRKAEETDNLEDRLLNYWIVIENIMCRERTDANLILPKSKRETEFILAKELVPPIQISQFVYCVGWELYWYLHDLLHSSQNARKLLTLPKELVEQCNLDPKEDTKIYLQPFIENLKNICNEVDRIIIKKKVEFTDMFYSDNSFAKKQIEVYTQSVKDDILLIYRYRNKIVHKAHYDKIILPHYVEKARKYAGDLLRTVMHEYSLEPKLSVEEILIGELAKVNRIIEKLDKNVKIDFLDFEV